MKSSDKARHDAMMARLRREGRLGDGGQVRLAPLSAVDARPPDRGASSGKKRRAPASSAPKKGSAQAGKSPETERAREALARPWGVDFLMEAFGAAGYSRDEAQELLRDYRQGRGVWRDEHLGPFLIHEPFVRAAVERGEDVPREILELHPHLLPEAKLLHGVEPDSREATLLREAWGLGWIGYNDSRKSFSLDGRWFTGSKPQSWYRAEAHRTSRDALRRYWKSAPARHNSHIDQGGPWTLAEQRERVEQETERLRRKYVKLGLKEPKTPNRDLATLREREATFAHDADVKAGMESALVSARNFLRGANIANAYRQRKLDEARYWKAAPDGDPDKPNLWRGKADTSSENETIHQRVSYAAGYQDVRDRILADKEFLASLDPYVVTRFKQAIEEAPA